MRPCTSSARSITCSFSATRGMASRSFRSITKSDLVRDPTKISIIPIPVTASAPDSKAAGHRGATPESPRRTHADLSIRCVATPQCQAVRIAARSSGCNSRIRPISRSRDARSTTLRRAASIVAVVPDVPRMCAAEATRSRSILSAVLVVIRLSIDLDWIDVYHFGSDRLLFCGCPWSCRQRSFPVLSHSSPRGTVFNREPKYYGATGTA